MFTGIIQHSGVIHANERGEQSARLVVRVDFGETLARGESIAVNGVCLTALPVNGGFAADVSRETLDRSTLGSLATGQDVNVERAMRLSDRLGGHLVQGHVDTTGTLLSIENQGEFAVYRWRYPQEFAPLVVNKGSIAVDGISLTIVDPDASSFSAALVPETLRRTNLGRARVGGEVNLEFDMMARMVQQLLHPYRTQVEMR